MERLKLVFGIHNHQPVGNFDHVFKDAVERCYSKQLDVFALHPTVRFSLHTSGPLLEWMSDNFPDYDRKVRAMVESGQVEPMGGGFYEPILPAIPRRDAIAQITLMQAEIEKRYGVRPKGLWLTERVWDPSLPELLADAGVKYTTVDDTHFRYAGFTQSPMTGYYLSERAGKSVAVFPIAKELRYLIPFKEPTEIIDFLKKVHAKNPGGLITYADDGEKFGIWPGTHDWVYKQKWLHRFLEALENNADWLEVLPFSDVKVVPDGRVYLPTASYDEMMEWSLPTEAILRYKHVRGEVEEEGRLDEYLPFLRGGLWNNFFVKYPESNLMNKRSIYISERIGIEFTDPENPLEMSEARRNILRSQCNCAYWHGLFGGVYFNYLRHAVWDCMLRAEAALDRADKSVGARRALPLLTTIDLDCDGLDETLVEGKAANWGFHRTGGAVFLIENRAKAFAFHNTLGRREEAYHHIEDEHGEGHGEGHDESQSNNDAPATIHDINYGKLNEIPVYDRAPRYSFQDHFFSPEEDMDRFLSSQWVEKGDFLNGLYSIKTDDPTRDRKSTRLNSSHIPLSRMPSSA